MFKRFSKISFQKWFPAFQVQLDFLQLSRIKDQYIPISLKLAVRTWKLKVGRRNSFLLGRFGPIFNSGANLLAVIYIYAYPCLSPKIKRAAVCHGVSHETNCSIPSNLDQQRCEDSPCYTHAPALMRVLCFENLQWMYLDVKIHRNGWR